ncbi:MAG: VWA domain-containing protein, partial [Spirochaetota bacterium]|nr:VWA domain-containing protein [Spirochaetota bacterium]
MKFTDPNKLYYLFIIIIICGSYFYYLFSRNRDLKSIGNSKILSKLSLNIKSKIRHIIFTFLIISFTFSIIALARPKWDKENIIIRERSSEIIFILDNSLSMLAEDVNNKSLSRFTLAKKEIGKLITSLSGNKMGLILSARDSQIECPLTFNSKLLKNMYLDKAKIAPYNKQGTKLAHAIENSFYLFSEGKHINKYIILVSDGEDHNSNLYNVLMKSKELNITIYAVGVGSKMGSPIPLHDWENGATDYKTDFYGEKVITVFREDILKQIASSTNGNYYYIDSNISLNSLLNKLKSHKLDQLTEVKLYHLKEQFQVFILGSLIFLSLILILPEKGFNAIQNIHIYKSKIGNSKLLIIFTFPFILMGFSSDVEKGNDFYSSHKYNEAIDKYNDALNKDHNNEEVYLLRGNSYYRKRNYKKAFEDYQNGLNLSKNNKLKSEFYYNMGKTSFQTKNLYDALKWYKLSLKNNPDHLKARYNYYLLKKMLSKKKPKSPKKSSENKSHNDNSKNPNQKSKENNSKSLQ